MRIAIDFDGTIAKDKYPKIGKVIKGSDYWIRRLKADGHKIIINTCRTGKYEGDVVKWMNDKFIPFDYINCNLPSDIQRFGMDCRKISADVYVDDKQIGGLPSWENIYKYITEKNERDFNKK